jgi:fumarate reductase flavoprotein subunit
MDPTGVHFDLHVQVVIIGGGGCGLSAALAARVGGAELIVIERDASPLGTTAMSTGLIPAAGTRFQRQAGISDSPELFAADILAKSQQRTDAALVSTLARESARTIEWLVDDHCLPLSLVDTFLYPGHSVMRMHGSPHRTGTELMAGLLAACERAGVDIATSALATELYASTDGRICGVRIQRPDGAHESIACDALILACCGFAGNRAMIEQYIPEIVDADFFGHPGNKGDAIRWGRALGADVRDMDAYQGHGGLAAGHGIPILWPLIVEGGIQVNALGQRFSDESLGYSEQAVKVVAQPGHAAWDIFDERLHRLMLEFHDYRDALEARAIVSADSPTLLADRLGLPRAALQTTLDEVADLVRTQQRCAFGRSFAVRPVLAPPYFAVKVHGALFHTQGGLAVDGDARVLRKDGSALPNLFAAGGAARGVSGPGCSGYIAGNGLLTATTLGRIAGEQAAALVIKR